MWEETGSSPRHNGVQLLLGVRAQRNAHRVSSVLARPLDLLEGQWLRLAAGGGLGILLEVAAGDNVDLADCLEHSLHHRIDILGSEMSHNSVDQ